MKSIKILQTAVVAAFILMVAAGVYILFFYESKLSAFGQLMGILWPVLLTMVIPALIGTPLTEAVRNLTAKPDASPATPPAA